MQTKHTNLVYTDCFIRLKPHPEKEQIKWFS